MRFPKICTASLAILLAFAAGCSDGGDPTSTSGLTKEQSVAIFSELSAAVNTAMFSAPSGSTGAMQVAEFNLPPTTHTINAACPQGGTAQVVITVNTNLDSNGTGGGTIDMVQTPNACQISTEHGAFTVSGAPNVTWKGNWQYTNYQPAPSFTLTAKGGYSYSGAVTGTCQVDMSYTINTQTAHGSMSGAMCGFQINQSF